MRRTLARRLSRAATLGAALAAIGTAHAVSPGFYIAGAFGQSQAGLDTSDQFRLDAMMVDAWSASHNILMWSDAALDKSDWGFEAGLGYQFSPYLAFEGAYLDSGGLTRETPLTVSNTGTDLSNATTRITTRRRGPALSLIGTWPAGGAVWLDARAGAFFGRSTSHVTFGLEGGSASQTDSSRRDSSAFFGAGVNWSTSPRTAIRLGYTHFGDDPLIHHDVGRVSMGFRVTF